MHLASSYYMDINQQDAQNSCDKTLFSIKCSTCFGLLIESIFRSNFYKLCSAFVKCRYHTCVCCVAIATQQPHASANTKCDVQLVKAAPEDGLIQSETCRAFNWKWSLITRIFCLLLVYCNNVSFRRHLTLWILQRIIYDGFDDEPERMCTMPEVTILSLGRNKTHRKFCIYRRSVGRKSY